jgi:hypothetical protein
MKRGSESGYVVVYALATFALLLLLPLTLAALRSWPKHSDMLPAVCALAVPTGILFAIEARRDLYAFCQYALVTAVLFGIAVGGALVLGTSGGIALWLLEALVVAGGALSARYVFQVHFSKDTVPDVLRQKFSESAIVEGSGVQWAAVVNVAEIPKTGLGTLSLIFQNCFDTAREVSIDHYVGNRLIDESSPLRAAPLETFELPGGEVVKVTIPIGSCCKLATDVELLTVPVAKGKGGLRIRRRRARDAFRRRSTAERLLLLAIGVVTWGGGLRVRLRLPARRMSSPEAPLTAQRVTIFALEDLEVR